MRHQNLTYAVSKGRLIQYKTVRHLEVNSNQKQLKNRQATEKPLKIQAMKIFGILIHVAFSGGLILRNPYSEGLLKHDETIRLQTVTGRANLKTETPFDCSKMCKLISGHHRMVCRTWIYDAWTQECNLFKNTNPEYTETPFDYRKAAKVFEKLDPTIRKRFDSPYSTRFYLGTDRHHRYRTLRNLDFYNLSASYQHHAAKFLLGEYSEDEMNRFTTRVPAFYIGPAKIPIRGDWYESTAIWWINELECAHVCDLTLGCKAWTYISDRHSQNAFEGCFLHEKIDTTTTTADCYTGYECSFGFNH